MSLRGQTKVACHTKLEKVENDGQTLQKLPPTATIYEIRTSINQSPAVLDGHNSPIPKATIKRGSLFGGLFQKEPSMVALEQFSANMQARRASVPTKNLPPPTSRKMPEFVPKVNSKWDGVPDAVREREKQRNRASRTSLIIPRIDSRDNGSQSAPLRSRCGSSSESYFSRSSVHLAGSEDTESTWAQSLCTTPSTEATYSLSQFHSQPASITSSLSISELPAVRAFFPDDIPETKTRPLSSDKSCFPAQIKAAVDSTITAGRMPSNLLTTIDTVPELTSAAVPSPLEQSPDTPGAIEASFPVYQSVPQPKENHFSIRTKEMCTASPADAFLAGEAKPLELPDQNQYQPSVETMRVSNHSHQDVSLQSHSSRERAGWGTNIALVPALTPREKLESTRCLIQTTSPPSSPPAGPKASRIRLFRKRTTIQR